MGPPAPELLDEHLEQVLFHLPPDDPAGLVRAALVCKRWRRVITDPGFRRRFRQFHRTPPLLGFLGSFIGDTGFTARFVPTTSFRPPRTEHRGLRAVDSRHGRVLLGTYSFFNDDIQLVVWDPVTDKQRNLPLLPRHQRSAICGWNAAVLCAAHGSCDHLDCHRGPFLVVFAVAHRGPNFREKFVRVYSSENGAWSEPATFQFQLQQYDLFKIQPSPLVGNSLHFKYDTSATIVKYNVVTREIAVIQLPPETHSCPERIRLMATQDGRLGFTLLNENESTTLSLWSREIGQDEDARWAQCRDIELNTPLPDGVNATFAFPPAVGFVDGADTISIGTTAGLFNFDLKSDQVVKKVILFEDRSICDVFPFLSFCTPALGAVSAGEVPEASASSA